MRLTPCNCTEGKYQRLPRRWWMRLFPGTVRYRCPNCHAQMLLRREAATKGTVGQVFLTMVIAVLAVIMTAYLVDYFQEAADRRWKQSVSD